MDNNICMQLTQSKQFTVITPTYNCADKIEKTILSVLSQNKNLFEYIIIDGKSNDDTIKIINQYNKNIDRIITEEDNGVYDAMNKGIKIACGKVIYFLGAGDVLEENVLEEISKGIPSDTLFLIYGNVYIGSDKSKIYDGKFNKFKLAGKNICHQSIFYSKDIFNVLGLYNLKYKTLADYVFNIKCFGCTKIKKIYKNKIISIYEGNGISTCYEDLNFREESLKLKRENLGILVYLYIKIGRIIKKIKRNNLRK